ncbi:MAG: alpha/beta fold hydrolase [Mycobacteriaceae bacterium]|uniref:alpha/beta fold hydrolase n=1 Tax=Corynebacterium sp. TaxID=1720 RepID=UPI003F9CC0C7
MIHRLRTNRTSLLAATVVTATLVSPPVAAADEPSRDITWEDCPEQVTANNAECGRIDVPEHHGDPDGDTISIGFVRVPASNPDARRGTLFGNPGGPGGDGYGFFGYDGEDGLQWPDELREEWDMVAVQPRGLTGSTPVDCDHEPEGWDPVRQQLEPAGYLKEACEMGTPGYTDSVNTWETAEDWESVRAALGEERISILGLSYGTQISSTYATNHPGRTDRLVLDSGFDSDRRWAGIMDDQVGGNMGALHDFTSWAADNNDTYGLGDTPLEVYQAWSRRIVAESGTNPTMVPPPAQVGDLPPGLQWAGQPAADVLTATGEPRARIENLFRMVEHPGSNQAASPTLHLTQVMLTQPHLWGDLAELLNGTAEMPSGDELQEAVQENPDDQIRSDMQAMLVCNENQVPADPTRIPGAIWNSAVGDTWAAPGDMAMSGLLCSGMEPDAPRTEFNGDELDVQPLQIQGTGDPSTVYDTHQPLAEAMGSHVITVDGPGHAQVGVGNAAVDDAVVEYLREGRTDVSSAPSRPVE